jgi:hypothetical protein
MASRWWVVLFLSVGLAGCNSHTQTSSPQCDAPSQCGSACCAAGQACLSPGTCAASQPCSADGTCPGTNVCVQGQCVMADAQCSFKPPPGEFSPRVAWTWTGSTNQPQYDNVLMTPVVVPLRRSADPFEAPAVVFNSILDFLGAGTEVRGVMRAVSGRDGTELWTSDPNHPLNGLSGIAAGDLFGDGNVEFVTGRWANGDPPDPKEEGLVAFDNSGHFLWEVKGLQVGWGAPSIANLTGGREASVVLGATVIDAHGNVVCQGSAGIGSNGLGPISTVADVDLDGKPEIVTGNAVYDASCRPKPGWPNGQPDGLVAVADFIGDTHPEIVVVSNGQVRMQDWTGKVVWGPVQLPDNCVGGQVPGSGEPCTPGGGGGAPTIADFDGDGKPEIGVAGNSTYTVLKPFAPTAILWSRTTQDTSKVTGSSVFTFDDEGTAKVVYGDECYTRVFSGPTGSTLFEVANPSCTVHENPVIADVDRDGRAEIVVATNRVCGAVKCPWGTHGATNQHGITVYKDLRDRWIGTRSIWNQHAYHVTNVNDDGSIPVSEQANWTVPGLNDFRLNPPGNPDYRAPDLAASAAVDAQVDTSACPGSLTISVRVWNRGAVLATAGVPVAFYEGQIGGKLLGVVQTKGAIVPGSSEQVSITLAPPPAGAANVVVQLNDDGTGQGVVGECNRSNNVVTLFGPWCSPQSG